ncbi:MAG: prepilin-type N-terminal cleavage/methylation domain-containing protein [Candidatus Sumerlaeaceae bacterium]|nr:prepilin-type N-terminal cleavage/methylation domain-containing protein [Candidatus Sumerlaeaceae bacterium]
MRLIRGFTLIELLVVVAIISILAAMAVPNFLEAQIRAKVSRARSDMRTLATGLEAYCVDNNAYPMCNNEMLSGWRPGSDSGNDNRYLERLSTPISYITSPLQRDPFEPWGRYNNFSSSNPQGDYTDQLGDPDRVRILDYKYGAIKSDAGNGGGFANVAPEKPVAWLVYSAGPDKAYSGTSTLMTSYDPEVVSAHFYDPTNGTVSYGDVWRGGGRLQPGINAWGAVFFRQLASAN